MLDALTLARFQFAVTTSVHFLFVALTLGLVTLVAITQTRYAITGKEVYGRMTRYWGLLYVINYAVGIATGLVMEFQFGLNWSGLSRLTGDVFGAPLAMETIVAFVLESTLLGMWIFGWGVLRGRGRWLHLGMIWGVVLTAYLSAFWVMVANAFLQHPVGYELDAAGHARLTDIGALFANPTIGQAFGHIASAAMLTGGTFMTGVSAWHLWRRTTEVEFFRRSLRTGVVTMFLAVGAVSGFGYSQFGIVADTQPTKLNTGEELVRAQAVMAGTHGPGDYTPPQWIHGALVGMTNVANILSLIALAALVLLWRDAIIRYRWARPMLPVLVAIIPVPFITSIAGWMVREVGRQPWAVYGLLRTEDAVSPLDSPAVLASFVGFGVLVVGLAVVDWWLLARRAAQGPGREFMPEEAA